VNTVISGFVEHDGATTHYLDCRPADGELIDADVPPILFVPGMTDVADDYRNIADHTGRRTVVVDLRAHGKSTAISNWDIDGHASDIDAVARVVIDGPVHLMTFSRGTCYSLAWCGAHSDRVLSLTIGDYPAREIGLTPETAERLLGTTWRGTPVRERVDEMAFEKVVAASVDRPLWHVVDELQVPVTVVRSSANVPMNDADWERYRELGVRRIRYDDSPHDIFRTDRVRYPRLAAEVAADVDRQTAAHRAST
jgi:non-heme chloroperoxidase